MKRHIFLSTVAAACLLLPASTLADPPQDRGQGQAEKKQQPHPQGPGQGQGAGRGAGAVRAPSERGAAPHAANPQAQQAPERGRQPHAQAAAPAPQRMQPAPAARAERAPAQQRFERGPAAPAVQRAVPNAPNLQRQAGGRAGQQQFSGQQQYQRPPLARQAIAPSLGEWRAPASRPQRNQAGQQWRQQHRNWDQNAAWRRNSDWWRNDSSFRLFTGLRMGFFFVPDRGYIALPSQYRNSHWQAGDYLPSWFRVYTVSNYARYGLPPPPYGCVWVWLNGDVALIDPSDGYILDIARNVW